MVEGWKAVWRVGGEGSWSFEIFVVSGDGVSEVVGGSGVEGRLGLGAGGLLFLGPKLEINFKV